MEIWCEICHACSKPAIWKGAHWCGCCPCTCTLIKNPIMMIWYAIPTSNLQPIRSVDQNYWSKFTYWMINSADGFFEAETNWFEPKVQRLGISRISRTRVRYINTEQFCCCEDGAAPMLLCCPATLKIWLIDYCAALECYQTLASVTKTVWKSTSRLCVNFWK